MVGGGKRKVACGKWQITSSRTLRIYLLDGSGREEVEDVLDGLIGPMIGGRWGGPGVARGTNSVGTGRLFTSSPNTHDMRPLGFPTYHIPPATCEK